MNCKTSFVSFDGFHISVNIETPHYLSEYVEYPIRVSYSANETLSGDSYVVVKRYSDFDNLRKTIKQTNLPVQLPPKKLFGKFEMGIVIERQIMLEKYLKCILNVPIICKSVPVTNFLQKEIDHIQDYTKIGFQQVSLDFRCETTWMLGKPLPEMGCRIKKTYIPITNISDQKKYVLNWTEFGPEYSSLNSKACHKLLKLLPSLKHENIYPVMYTMDNETSVSVIRPLTELGSLHDYLLRVKPTNPIVTKYCYQSSYPTLINDISLFGRQILIALKYLHDKGWPYGHLHIRNVLMVTNERCALTDIENSIIGVVPQVRHFYVGILKKLTFEEIDIYCFGRIIYHMVFGHSLESTFITDDDKLRWPSPAIRELLFSMLTENVLKSGFPTIDKILENSIFKSFNDRFIDKGPLKLSDSCKEFLQSIHSYSLKLLIDDQKLVKSQRRKTEADAFEMKKKKKRKDESRRLKNSIAVADYGDIMDTYTKEKDGDSVKSSKRSSNAALTVAAEGSSSSPKPKHDTNNNVSSRVSVPAVPTLPPPVTNGSTANIPARDQSHTQLLDVISGFNKSNLRKTKTNDKSAPRL